MPGDNFHFDMTGVPLKLALEVATQDHKKVVGWSVDDNCLVLYWYEDSSATPLPAPLEGDAIVEFVRSWLRVADYGPEPDHDGDNDKGARVYNEAWGKVSSNWHAFVAIQPVWNMYGK